MVGKYSGLAEKSKNRLRRHQEKHESMREKARDDAAVETSMSRVLDLRPDDEDQEDPPFTHKEKGRGGAVASVNGGSDEDSDLNSEVEEQEQMFSEKKRKGKGKPRVQSAVKPFAQRDLVSLAFAGDKVVQVRPFLFYKNTHIMFVSRLQDFQEAKQREILEDAPKEVDTTLPGWVRFPTTSIPLHSPHL